LTFLWYGGHISMPDRISRGLWPRPPLKIADIIRHFVQVIESEKWFPHAWKPDVPGESIWEGGVIERKPRGYTFEQSNRQVERRFF